MDRSKLEVTSPEDVWKIQAMLGNAGKFQPVVPSELVYVGINRTMDYLNRVMPLVDVMLRQVVYLLKDIDKLDRREKTTWRELEQLRIKVEVLGKSLENSQMPKSKDRKKTHKVLSEFKRGSLKSS